MKNTKSSSKQSLKPGNYPVNFLFLFFFLSLLNNFSVFEEEDPEMLNMTCLRHLSKQFCSGEERLKRKETCLFQRNKHIFTLNNYFIFPYTLGNVST